MYMPQAVQYNSYGQPVAPPNPYGQPQYYGSQAPGYPAPYGSNYVQQAAPTQSNSNHTRNLIGQASVSSGRLNDPSGKPGIWFVLQDLSVRTEGTFR